jgi:hypothetical protein
MKRIVPILSLLALVSLLSGCELVEGIFKAGVWVGVLLVVVVVGFILWLLSKLTGGGRS